MLRTLFKASAPLISPEEARLQIQKKNNVVLIDVRTKEEYRTMRIPGSVNIPLDKIESVQSVIQDKDTMLIVYCLSGARASSACRILVKMGYTQVMNLGGIRNWPYEIEGGAQ